MVWVGLYLTCDRIWNKCYMVCLRHPWYAKSVLGLREKKSALNWLKHATHVQILTFHILLHINVVCHWRSLRPWERKLLSKECNTFFNCPTVQNAILYRPVVARVVMHPHALHCTSALSVPSRMMRGFRAPAATMACLFSAGTRRDGNELKDSRASGVRWWVTPSTTLGGAFHFQFQPNLNALPNTVVVNGKFTYYPVYLHSTYRSACLRPVNNLGYLRRY